MTGRRPAVKEEGRRMTRRRNRLDLTRRSRLCEHLVGPAAVSPGFKILATSSGLINFRPPDEAEEPPRGLLPPI